jgi:hypothetical protein
MKKTATLAALCVALLISAVPLVAHHAFSAEYDAQKTVTVKGKMVKFEWINPHSWVHIEVVNPANGSKTVWRAETPPINVLFRNGWTKQMAEAMVAKGEVVTISGPAAKDGSNHLWAPSLTREDGSTVLGLGGTPPTDLAR